MARETTGWRRISSNREESTGFTRMWKKKAKFLVDQSLGAGFAEILRQRRFNVIYSAEAGLLNHSDEDYVAYAQRHNRILLTHDDDFWDDHKFPLRSRPGIVVLPGASGSDRPLFRSLSIVTHVIGRWRATKVKVKVQGDLTQVTIKDIDEFGNPFAVQKRCSGKGPVWEREINPYSA
jgi:predicted nuclease of predicted toxin-antitoxin system